MKRYLYPLCICCFILSGCDDNETLMVSPDISHSGDGISSHNDVSDEGNSHENDGCKPTCDEGFKCEKGDCLPICTDDLTYCNGECLDLEILHLADCSSCIENFCDSDNNLINGCEIDAKAFDKENCGGCGVECGTEQRCNAGTCVPECSESETDCGNICVNLSEQHLDSCELCADGFGNCDEDMSNGCETAIKAKDVNNCGGCGVTCKENEKCDAGSCVLDCKDSETICGNVCVNLAEKHLSTCDKCAGGYDNCDGNMSNGCEVAINGSDVNNCGACGKTCGIGESCTSSQCKNSYNVHRRFIVGTNVLAVRASASDSAEKYGELPVYTYINALGENKGWYLVEYNKKAGWVNGAFTMDAGDQYVGRKAVDLAETYLYTKTGFCTFDHLTHSPILQNFTNLSGYSNCYYGYENNCANFTTSILVTVGLASVNEIGSWETKAYYCEQGRDGYHIVDKTQAKPGDIWYKDASAGKHIELVMGYHNGNYVLIGSNNFNASNYSACANTYSGVDVSHYQRVSYDYRSDGYICTRQ